MVRLKVSTMSSDTVCIQLFQFLMVRLKDRCVTFWRDVLQISIPYGAIKRYMPTSITSKKMISIPYGAIKSSWFRNVYDTAVVFQFLMVRLKDCLFSSHLCFGIYFNSLWCD